VFVCYEYPFGVSCCVWFSFGQIVAVYHLLKVEVIKDGVLFQSIVRLCAKGDNGAYERGTGVL
jgi:hypothetical protein